MSHDLKPLSKTIIYLILLVVCLICVIPIITIVAISFSDQITLTKEGFSMFVPRGFTFSAYEYCFNEWEFILRSYGVSILVTVMGCVFGLIFNSLLGYVLSRKDYAFKKQLTIYTMIPMLLNGGMVPTYILMVRGLHLKDTLWAVLLPGLVVPWFVVLLRTFFSEISPALIEAATIDGAGEITIFTKIIIPLSKPSLATVGMFLTLNYWNDWYQYYMYIDSRELYNLQYRLYVMMINAREMIKSSMMMGFSAAEIPTETMRMAMCVLAAGPMLMVFPFFQKYFVKGLQVGGVKG